VTRARAGASVVTTPTLLRAHLCLCHTTAPPRKPFCKTKKLYVHTGSACETVREHHQI